MGRHDDQLSSFPIRSGVDYTRNVCEQERKLAPDVLFIGKSHSRSKASIDVSLQEGFYPLNRFFVSVSLCITKTQLDVPRTVHLFAPQPFQDLKVTVESCPMTGI